MKKLVSILLALCLFATCAAVAEADGAEAARKLTFGYLAPDAAGGERGALCAGAFAYAAQRKGVEIILERYDPDPEAASAPGEGEAMRALEALLENDLDGAVVAPESPEQAVAMAERAGERGVPLVIEGVDMTGAGAEPPSYVAAVYCADSPAYAAAMWLNGSARGSQMLHCALPGADLAIQAGLERALADADYLEIADEIVAEADSAAEGSAAVDRMYNSYAMFSCVLADSAALARGCAENLRARGEDVPVAAIARSSEDLALLDGAVDVLAFAPAAVEGVACFQALYGFATEGILSEREARMIYPAAVTVTPDNRDAWIEPGDFAAAYALAYPGEALPGGDSPEAEGQTENEG